MTHMYVEEQPKHLSSDLKVTCVIIYFFSGNLV